MAIICEAILTAVAYSYVRFSTKSQVRGDSLERQLAKARAYAKRYQLVLNESSYQDLGISAFKGKNATHGALKAFLDAVENGSVPAGSTLLVENFDRLARTQITDALTLFLNITGAGITIVTLSDELVYNRKSIDANWTTLIVTLAVMARAHEESAVKSARVKSGKQAKLAAGLKHGKCPAWLRVSDDRMSFEELKEKADFVRAVFALRAQGIGSLRIAQHLNLTYGMKWSAPQVAHLLQNPAVIGTRLSQAGYEPLEHYYPPVVSLTEFHNVKRLMSANIGTKRGRHAEDEPNLFTGLVRCAICGSSMRFFRESRSVNQRYLKCLAAVTKQGCHAGYINYDAFEQEAIGWLLLDQDEELIPLIEKKPTPAAVDAAELQALKEKRGRFIDAYGNGVLSMTDLSDRIATVDSEIKTLEAARLSRADTAGDRLFAEKAWELVERHEDAKRDDNKSELYTARRQIKAAFQGAVDKIALFPEARKGDVYHGKFNVSFRGYDGEPTRKYKRPALTHIKGIYNTTRRRSAS